MRKKWTFSVLFGALLTFVTWYSKSEIFLQSQYLTASLEVNTSPCVLLRTMMKSSGSTLVDFIFTILRWNLYSTYLKNCVDFTNFLGIVGISFQWLSLSIFIGSTIWSDVFSFCSFKQPSPPCWWWKVSGCVRQTSLNITIGLWSSCRVKLVEYLYCSF